MVYTMILHDTPLEERWVKAWEQKTRALMIAGVPGTEGIPNMVKAVCWIAQRSSGQDYEIFLPFLRIVMRHYPAPRTTYAKKGSPGK